MAPSFYHPVGLRSIPSQPRMCVIYYNRSRTGPAPCIWLKYHSISSFRCVLLWPVKDVTSCVKYIYGELNPTCLVPDTLQSYPCL